MHKILYELFFIRLKTRHTTQTYNMLYTTNTTRLTAYKTYNNVHSTYDIPNKTIPMNDKTLMKKSHI